MKAGLWFLVVLVFAVPAFAKEASWAELDAQALSLYQQGRRVEAAEAAKQALRVAERSFGPHDARLAKSLNQVANSYRSVGQYRKAEEMYERSLAIRERVFGHDHPEVARVLNNLALVYQDRGRAPRESEALYQRALGIFEKRLGPNHPVVAIVLENYSMLLEKAGRRKEADAMAVRATQIRSSQR